MNAPDRLAPLHDDGPVLDACRAVLLPLARLAVARGLGHAALDELLREALVQAARELQPQLPLQRAASRLSAITGLHRREVQRLLRAEPPALPRRSLATEVFTRWISDPAYRRRGKPLPQLPRQGPAPSFDALAQSITKDMHPRSLLEQLHRLGLVEEDTERGVVRLLKDRVVPADDERRLWSLLGANVGDHLSAAAHNVLKRGAPHLEQAIFADGLSAASLDEMRPVIAAQWQRLVAECVPMLREMVERDGAEPEAAQARLRIGLYTYGFDPAAAAPPAADDPAAVPAHDEAEPPAREGGATDAAAATTKEEG